MGKKYWSKVVPNCTCEVIGEPDSKGVSLGYITDLNFDPDGPFASLLNLEEGWSPTEVTSVPEYIPDIMYLSIDDLGYQIHDTEIKAAVWCSKFDDAIGYVPVLVQRNGMVTP